IEVATVVTAPADCGNAETMMTTTVRWAGPEAFACISYTLTAEGPRNGETSAPCSFPDETRFAPLRALSDWSYDASVDEWTSSTFTANGAFVPGSYRGVVVAPASPAAEHGQADGFADFTLANSTAANADPTNCSYH